MDEDTKTKLVTMLSNNTADEVSAIMRSIENQVNDERANRLLSKTPDEVKPKVDETSQAVKTDETTQAVKTDETTQAVKTDETTPPKNEGSSGDEHVNELIQKALAPIMKQLETFLATKKEKPEAQNASDTDIKQSLGKDKK